MKLGHVEMFVSDTAKAAEFYGALGFEEVVRQGPSATWLKSGEAEVLLRKQDGVAHTGSYGECGPGLVLYTDDLEGAMAKLKAAGISPAACDRGEECCPLYRDPDGNWIQLVNPDHQ